MRRLRSPNGGLPVWDSPNPQAAPRQTLPGRSEVDVLEEAAYGWTRVRWFAGEGWVDGRLLEPLDTPGDASARPTARSQQVNKKTNWPPIIAGVVVGALLLGAAFVLGSRSNNTDTSTSPTTDGSAVQTTAGVETDGDPSSTIVTTAQTTTETVGLSDAELEQIIQEAQQDTTPMVERVSLNGDATELLQREFTSAGIDLTGIDVTVYSAGGSESFISIETNDDTPLVADAESEEAPADDNTPLVADAESEEAPADDLILVLLESRAVGEFGVEWMVMEHTGTDDQGPYVLSVLVDLDDLHNAAYNDADLFEELNAQVTRG